MNKRNKEDIDLANFAESLIMEDIKEIKTGNKSVLAPKINPNPDILDVSKIKLDESQASDFLSQCFGIEKKVVNQPKIIKSPSPTTKKESDLESRLQEFVVNFSKMLKQGENLINEMTTCGMIGSNFSAPKVKKKKLRRKLNVKF